MSASIVISGRAYGRDATLEVSGDTLTWRARRGGLTAVAENIATTTDEVRDVTWVERRLSRGGAIGAALSCMWMGTEGLAFGIATFSVAAAWCAYRAGRPQRWLGLDLGVRWLVLRVDPASAITAAELAARVRHRLTTGELPGPPRKLP